MSGPGPDPEDVENWQPPASLVWRVRRRRAARALSSALNAAAHTLLRARAKGAGWLRVACVFALVLAAGGFLGAVALAFTLPDPSELSRVPLPLTTRVYARDGTTLLHTFAEEDREYARLAEIPRVLIDATVAVEDKSFWVNPGVDAFAIARATLALVREPGARPQGASTITQQLVKQRLLGDERTIDRKVREAVLALRVTQSYSKDQVMEMYLNQIYYGAGAYGVKTAARVYYGVTDLKKLSLAQAALLAGLPQGPSILDPTQPQNRQRARERRDHVLDQMVLANTIDAAAAAAAKAEPLGIVERAPQAQRAPHFIARVREELASLLGGDERVARSGLEVITTLDARLQETAEAELRDHVRALGPRGVHNAALVCIDPQSGDILAYVGSAQWDADRPELRGQFDAAGVALRQPGSAFKPIVYTNALLEGATVASVVVDARTDFGGGYVPGNADDEFHGPVTMRQALRESRNVPAIKFQEMYGGPGAVSAVAEQMGIRGDWAGSDARASMALGVVPVRLLDMTSAYGVYAASGMRVTPGHVRAVRDARGRVLYERRALPQRVLPEDVAWLMNDLLTDTTDPRASFMFGGATAIGRVAGLKTGTAEDQRDLYAVGYTPQMVTGVWMGNSDNRPISRNVTSVSGPATLWRDFMRAAHQGLPARTWSPPPTIIRVSVVVAPGAHGGYGSGLRAVDRSPFAREEPFIRGTVPPEDTWFREDCWLRGHDRDDDVLRMHVDLGREGPWRTSVLQWLREAREGLHDADGRYDWAALLSSRDEPCPSPSPRPSSRPSPSMSPASTSTAVPSPTQRSATPRPTPRTPTAPPPPPLPTVDVTTTPALPTASPLPTRTPLPTARP